jgi:hypothetical protein
VSIRQHLQKMDPTVSMISFAAFMLFAHGRTTRAYA